MLFILNNLSYNCNKKEGISIYFHNYILVRILIQKGVKKMALHNKIGKIGEELALRYLKNRNYYIIEQNYYNKFGEIDIIAEKDKYTVFIEVKTRSSEDFMPLEETVYFSQIEHLKNTALYYFAENNLIYTSIRFDLIALKINIEKKKIEKIKHFKNIID